MNEDRFNKEKIEAYLLGALPDEEAERFDELSFTDDDFADRLKASEADLVDQYINGEMRGARREKFESYYLASPLRRERVEFARQLQTFAEREVRAAEKTVEKEEAKSGFFASLNIFKNRNSFFQFGFAAATVLILILSGLLIFRNIFKQTDTQIAQGNSDSNIGRPTPRVENVNAASAANQTENVNIENRNPLNTSVSSPSNPTEKTNKKTIIEPTPTPKRKETLPPSKPIVASFLLLPSLRSSRIQSVSIDKNVTDAAVQLRLEADDYPAYRVNLVDQSSGKILWRSEAVKARSKGADKQLDIGFPAKFLKSQIYTLQISGVSADGKVEILSDYPFRVVR